MRPELHNFTVTLLVIKGCNTETSLCGQMYFTGKQNNKIIELM